VPERIWI